MYTPEAYLTLIRNLKEEGYRFAHFDERDEPAGKIIYLRHDIDYDPRWAADFAALNNRSGIAGTFCLQLRSPIYNLAAAPTQSAIEEILSCGQRIAFHFSFTAAPEPSDEAIAALVNRDFGIAQAIVPAMAPLFSWHNPSLIPGLIERCLDLKVNGLTNLYSRRFCRDTVYKSDSNWRYSIDEWHSLRREGHIRMQLLIHPFQWMARGRDMRDVLAKTFARCARVVESEFSTNYVYREMHPHGLSDSAYAKLAASVLCRDHSGA
jgi:hypothetical protein